MKKIITLLLLLSFTAIKAQVETFERIKIDDLSEYTSSLLGTDRILFQDPITKEIKYVSLDSLSNSDETLQSITDRGAITNQAISINNNLNVRDNLIIGNYLKMVKSIGESQGLTITISPDLNGNLPIQLNPNNVSNPGLVIGGVSNLPISFVVNGGSKLTATADGVRLGSSATGYELPLTRGSDNQILKTNSNGEVTWQNVSSGSGDDFGSHSATQDVDMSNHNILNVDGVILNDTALIEYDAGDNFSYDAGSSMLTWSGDLDVNGELSSLGLDLNSESLINLSDGVNPTDAVNKSQLDNAISSVSNDLDYVMVTDSIYTMSISDVEAGKTFNIKTFRADGITPPDTTRITYPSGVDPSGKQLITAFLNISGSEVLVVPGNGVVDYRDNSQKQYYSGSDVKGYLTVTSIAQDSIMATTQDWVVSDYIAPIYPNLIINSNFDNTSDVTYTDEWAISGGEAVYTHDIGSSVFEWALSTDMTANSSYQFTLDVTNLISGNARFRIFVVQDGVDVEIFGNSNYNSGVDVTFNAPSGANSTAIKILTSSAASSFNMDNVSLTQL